MRRLLRWLKDGKLLWVASSVVLVAVVLAYVRKSELSILLTGLCLQLLGLGTIFQGIEITRRTFGLPTLWAVGCTWLSQAPWFRLKGPTAAFFGTAPTPKSEARLCEWMQPREELSHAERFALLEENLERLKARTDHLEREFDTKFCSLANSLESEQHSRETQDTAIRAELQSVQTAGINLSVVGTTWLAVGLIMSTVSNQLSQWLQ